MPYVCDVEYKIAEAFSSGRITESKLAELIVRAAVKETFYVPFRTAKKIADCLTKDSRRFKSRVSFSKSC